VAGDLAKSLAYLPNVPYAAQELHLGYLHPRIYSLVFWLYNGSMNNRFIAVDGARLRQLRKERAFSQRDLQRMTGIAHDSISQLETGKRRAQPKTIRTLAEALGVEPKELIKEEE
jgi:DNA-binding XRE family transcriptional regulator